MSYFKDSEFRCPCCSGFIVSAWLKHLLNRMREAYGKPIYINSGYRCKKHNIKVGGKEDSSHLQGLAADLKCTNSRDRFLLVGFALEAGFKRIGIGFRHGFIHLDVDGKKPQNVIWVYDD